MERYIPPSQRHQIKTSSPHSHLKRLTCKTLHDLNNQIQANLTYNKYLNNKLCKPHSHTISNDAYSLSHPYLHGTSNDKAPKTIQYDYNNIDDEDENLSYQNDEKLIEKFGITTNQSDVTPQPSNAKLRITTYNSATTPHKSNETQYTIGKKLNANDSKKILPPKTLPNDNNSNENEIVPIQIRTDRSKDPITTPHTPPIPNITFVHEKLNGKIHINKNKSQKIDDAIMRALTHILLGILLSLLLSHVYSCTEESYSAFPASKSFPNSNKLSLGDNNNTDKNININKLLCNKLTKGTKLIEKFGETLGGDKISSKTPSDPTTAESIPKSRGNNNIDDMDETINKNEKLINLITNQSLMNIYLMYALISGVILTILDTG